VVSFLKPLQQHSRIRTFLREWEEERSYMKEKTLSLSPKLKHEQNEKKTNI